MTVDEITVLAEQDQPVRPSRLRRWRGPIGATILFVIIIAAWQAAVSAGLVHAVKRGRERYYHLNPEPLEELTEWLRPFERYWRQRLSDLANVMEERDR